MMPSAAQVLIDNTGHVETSETVRFGVDGRAYEIDLSARSASELRSMVGRYIRVARKVRRVALVPSQSPGRTEHQPAPSGGKAPRPPEPPSSGKTPSGGGTARAALDEPPVTPSVAATEADVRGGGHGLTDREKQELRSISDAAKPQRAIVADRLRTKGLADRDTAGHWWLTDAGRRKLTSA
jgi:nucleoid-associated protein Lsr2